MTVSVQQRQKSGHRPLVNCRLFNQLRRHPSILANKSNVSRPVQLHTRHFDFNGRSTGNINNFCDSLDEIGFLETHHRYCNKMTCATQRARAKKTKLQRIFEVSTDSAPTKRKGLSPFPASLVRVNCHPKGILLQSCHKSYLRP